MTDLFDISEQRLKNAIETVAADIGNACLSKKRLFETMEELHGCTSANGTWTQRDAYDLLEAGLALHLTSLGPIVRADIPSISDLVESLPTQTVRSEDQIRFQQFSTPADLAALAVIAAQPRSSDIVLEPSAGHGSLVTMLPSVEELHLNELDRRRREKLKLLFTGATITGFDGAMLTSLAAPELRPTLILMNPPFSRSQGRGVDEYAALRHLRAALSKASPGGRVVAIMPDWFTTSAKMIRIYEETFANCTVQTSARLAKCYHKQGTSVAVRLMVIDKTPGNSKPSIIARDTVRELADCLRARDRGARRGCGKAPPRGVRHRSVQAGQRPVRTCRGRRGAKDVCADGAQGGARRRPDRKVGRRGVRRAAQRDDARSGDDDMRAASKVDRERDDLFRGP